MRRQGKYLLFPFQSGRLMVVHAMLTGRFQYCDPEQKRRARTAFVLALDNGLELRYFDQRLMGKVYLARDEGDLPAVVPRWAEMGPDAMSPALSEELFVERLRKYRGQIKTVLTTEQCVAGIGNAYADEVLWEARLHPYRRRAELPDETLHTLFRAVRSVMEWAMPIVTERMETRGAAGRPLSRPPAGAPQGRPALPALRHAHIGDHGGPADHELLPAVPGVRP